MNKYTVNFLLEADVTIDATSLEEAKAIAENLIDTDYEDVKLEYVYVRDVIGAHEKENTL